MKIFEDSINLLKGAAFSNIKVFDSYLFLESSPIFNEYIVPLTFLDKFDTQAAHELFLNEIEENKNISYYLRQTLVSDYSDYFKSLKLSEDYIDSYMLYLASDYINIDYKETELVEVEENNFEEYKSAALEIFESWSNEEDYVTYFNQLSMESTNDEKTFKDFLLLQNKQVVSIGSAIFDKTNNLTYIHNAGTHTEFRRNGFFNIINTYIINISLDMNISRIYSIVEKDGDSYNAYKKIGFKEEDSYYSFS